MINEATVGFLLALLLVVGAAWLGYVTRAVAPLDEMEIRKMRVRAKVVCESIEDNAVRFTTVYEGNVSKDTENARFTQATPWGRIELGIDNPVALEQFTPGKEYYVDFSPAPADSGE